MVENQPSSQQSGAVRLTDYLRFIRERWWVVVVVTVVLVGATAYLTSQRSPQYQASARVIHITGGWEQTLLGLSSYYVYSQQITVDAELLAGPDTAKQVKSLIHSERSAEELRGMIGVSSDVETQTLRVVAASSDPVEAAAVANGFAKAFVSQQEEDMRTALEEAQSTLKKQIKALSGSTSSAAEVTELRSRLRQLQTLSDLAGSDYKMWQEAQVPAAPVSPQPLRDSLLALVIGIVGGIALAFLFEYLDKRIKDEQGIEHAFGLPALVTLPFVGRRGLRRLRSKAAQEGPPPGVGFRKGQSSLLEPYMLLRSNLRYFGVDHPLRVVMITSALPTQGKTTVSINLGLAMALAGDRVLLVECDMRRPRVHDYLSLENHLGLSGVLAGTTRLAEAVQSVPVSDFMVQSGAGRDGRDSSGKCLHVLPAGPMPPNPGELMASKRMAALVKQLIEEDLYDSVLVDTAPALLVADALVIAPHADGVLVTARLGMSKRDEAVRVREVLDRAGARLLGVVVGGRERRRGYYGYGYGYGRYGYGSKGGYGYEPDEVTQAGSGTGEGAPPEEQRQPAEETVPAAQ